VKPAGPSKPFKQSRFLLVTSLVALAFITTLVAILAVPSALIFFVLVVIEHAKLAWGVGLAVGMALLSLCWLRRWDVVAGALVGLGIAYLLSAVPAPNRSFSRWAADLADVAYYYSDLSRMADDSRREGQSPVIAVLDIDGFGSLTSGLAFDPSGEIMLPAARRSKEWTAVGGETELSIESMSARHVIGSYYAWSHD
jgi:hypothetical protein